MNGRTTRVGPALVFAALAGCGVAQAPTEAPKGVKATLTSARASQAAFETAELTLTIALDRSAEPLRGIPRADLVRARCLVVAGADRQGKWAVVETTPPEGTIDLYPGESFAIPFKAKLPEGFAGSPTATAQWIGAGPLKGLRSAELTLVVRDGRNPVVSLDTSEGPIVLELWPEFAPNHVANLVRLVEKGFYDGLKWHRVVPDFVVQTGCPKGDGTGGPGYAIPAEFNDLAFSKGVVGMARGGEPNSAGSQFFICVADAQTLNKNYTAFGRVIEGQDVADRISKVARDPAKDRPLKDVLLRKATVARPPGYEPPEIKKT